jgi:hypothetical protein
VFYRYVNGAQIAVDLDGLYQGQTLFLVGGGPSLGDVDLDLLRQDGVITLGLNNVPLVFKPNLWLGADKPQCFSPHIFALPEVTRFMPSSRKDEVVSGRPVIEYANTLFFGTQAGFTPHAFLQPSRDLVWWRSVFPMALQLAHRLGFRKVFLVGCDLSYGGTYAWETDLTAAQAQYSQRTYDDDVSRLAQLMPTFQANGFTVESCTPGSAAHAAGVPYLPLAEAVAGVAQAKPTDARGLVHSSGLSGGAP